MKLKNKSKNYMNKYKKQIKKKTYLLKISQQKSPRFILKEKLAEKKFQMNMNKFNIKEICEFYNI